MREESNSEGVLKRKPSSKQLNKYIAIESMPQTPRFVVRDQHNESLAPTTEFSPRTIERAKTRDANKPIGGLTGV